MASLFAAVRRMLAAPAVLHGDVDGGPGRSFASPYSRPNHLAHVVAPDWFPVTLDRSRAMRVPALARARLVICSTIARTPMAVYRGGQRVKSPAWVDSTSGPISPYHRMLWTVDDLLFYGMSLWAVQRGADGFPVAADRVPWDTWSLQDGRVRFTERAPDGSTITDREADPASVILIPGNDSGILDHGMDAICQAIALLESSGRAARNPSAYLELHQTNDVPITPDERDRLLDGWAAARRGERGGVAFTSAGIEVREHGAAAEHLLIEGRTAAALDIARAAGIPGSIVDAIVAEGLTYQNADAKDDDLRRYGLASYTGAIAARLGLDDMVPSGQSVAFLGADGSVHSVPDDGAGPTATVTPIRQTGV